MLHIRAEHILAVFVTGIFLLVDAAVLCLFVSAFDAEPTIIQHQLSTTHGYVETPELSVSTLTSNNIGSHSKETAAAIKDLEQALSTQLQTLTQNKTAP